MRLTTAGNGLGTSTPKAQFQRLSHVCQGVGALISQIPM
jgi:hypothetical protein